MSTSTAAMYSQIEILINMAARHENNYLQRIYVIVYRKERQFVPYMYVLCLHVGHHLCLLSFMFVIKAVVENLFHLHQSTAN